VADLVVTELAPIRERHTTLMRDTSELDRLLARGADRARGLAEPKARETKRRMGLLPPGATSARPRDGVDLRRSDR
jgi:tryptophanyl-tRNA synthetase